jgi:D-alanyl-D-alanine-carboxypeptidase/D-alanyl-D-alanine-endopeptidase
MLGLAVGAFASGRTAISLAGRIDQHGTPPSEQTVFQIGSITKDFTALALADAVTRKELDFDTPLASLLPGAPAARSGAPITLGQLAAHTSGLPRLPKGLLREALHHPSDPYRDFSTAHLLTAMTADPRRTRAARSE